MRLQGFMLDVSCIIVSDKVYLSENVTPHTLYYTVDYISNETDKDCSVPLPLEDFNFESSHTPELVTDQVINKIQNLNCFTELTLSEYKQVLYWLQFNSTSRYKGNAILLKFFNFHLELKR